MQAVVIRAKLVGPGPTRPTPGYATELMTNPSHPQPFNFDLHFNCQLMQYTEASVSIAILRQLSYKFKSVDIVAVLSVSLY